MTTESDCAWKAIDDCDGLTCLTFCEWSFAPADVNKVYECPDCGLDGDCTYCIFDSDKPAGYDDADKQGCLPRPGAARGDPRPLCYTLLTHARVSGALRHPGQISGRRLVRLMMLSLAVLRSPERCWYAPAFRERARR